MIIWLCVCLFFFFFFFFSSRRRHTRCGRDWSSDVCSSDLYFHLVLTTLKVLMIAGIAVVGFTASSGGWSNFGTQFMGAKGGMAGFVAALVAALWAYDGWNDLNMVGGEIRNPERNIPVALIAGVALA